MIPVVQITSLTPGCGGRLAGPLETPPPDRQLGFREPQQIPNQFIESPLEFGGQGI